ncbi:RodZ domain-containing protein [Candidatus Omnitrophota bacterium]
MELSTICNALKKARLEKDISLQEVSKQTKLHPSMLRNIEETKGLDDIGKFYLKGFLKIYAQFLGQSDLLKDIDTVFTEEKQKKPKFGFRNQQAQPTALPAGRQAAVPQSTEVKQPAVPQSTEPRRAEQLKEPEEQNTSPVKVVDPSTLAQRIKPNRTLLYVVIAVVVLLAVVRLTGRTTKPTKAEPASETAPAAEIQPSKKPSFATPSPTDNTAGSLAKPLASILTKGDVLVEVRADGKLIFQNIIIKGSKESWMAQEKLELKISNPSLVSLEIDNRIIPTSNTKRPASYVVTSEGFRVEK